MRDEAIQLTGAKGVATSRELPGLARAAWLVARKDLAIEFRTRTAFFSAIVFALLGLTIFYFAWDATAVAAIEDLSANYEHHRLAAREIAEAHLDATVVLADLLERVLP